MSTEQWLALSAAVVAVIALSVSVVLASALRRVRADVRTLAEATTESAASPQESAPHDPRPSTSTVPVHPTTPVSVPNPTLEDAEGGHQPAAHDPQIVTRDGRVVVLPSTEQVVEATLGKPMIRGAVLSHGIRYALRPESRDRLRGIIRREYRRRRKTRLRAGRRAARTADIPPREAQSWLGTATNTRLNVEDDGGS